MIEGMKMRDDAILAEIDAAFCDTVPVPSERLVNSLDLEPLAIKQLLKGKRWRDLTANVLFQYDERADASAIIAFLSDDAYRHFLPAFMSFVLSQGKNAGLTIDALLFRLTEERAGRSPSLFNEQQRAAVRSFLGGLKRQHAHDESTCTQIESAMVRWQAG
jgi:hypothetical protein